MPRHYRETPTIVGETGKFFVHLTARGIVVPMSGAAETPERFHLPRVFNYGSYPRIIHEEAIVEPRCLC